ncbi:MAG: T9SS type A sorting domain-containing protein [Melioribacteraceae bacterium]|nr:MAG: T9SS type A sorting domain-containing protein [Melioribacteraceae bacterium]
MKISLKTTFMVLYVLTAGLYSQTQERIEWPSLADSPWPVLRGDAQGTGRSEYVGPKTPNIVWTADMPYGIIYGPTIGYNDMLYFGTFAINTQSPGNFLYAYNSDGTEFWRYNNEYWWANENAPIAAKDSTIYFGSDTGMLYALDYWGNLKWKTEVADTHRFQMAIHKGGDLYISAGNLKVVSPDGEIKLINNNFTELFGRISFSPDGEQIYFSTGKLFRPDEPSDFYCTDLEGNVLWKVNSLSPNYEHPAIDNEGNVYFFGTDSVQANVQYLLSYSSNGQLNWKYNVISGFGQYSAASITKSGDIVFPAIKKENGVNFHEIISLNKVGEENWIYIIEHEGYMGDYRPDHGLVSDDEGNIYFGSTGGVYFWALNNQGELMWKIPLDGNEFDNSPAIGSDGTLYIGTHQSSSFQDHKNSLIAIRDEPSSVEENELPKEFRLEQNYPNPFNPSTKIKYQLPQASYVTIKIYDMLGREIKVLTQKHLQAGNYELTFDGSDLASGTYIYRITAGDFTDSKKLLLLK